MLKFKPEDFRVMGLRSVTQENYAANIAQQIFDKWVESLDVVYHCTGEEKFGHKYYSTYFNDAAVYKSRILPPEEIEDECEHENIGNIGHEFWCHFCKKRLKPTGWEEA